MAAASSNVVEIIIKGNDLSRNASLSSVKGLMTLKNAAAVAGVALTALAAKAAVDVVSAIASLTNEAIKNADAMGEMAQKAGLNVDDFSRLAFAANLASVSQEDLKNGMRDLSKHLREQGRSGADLSAEMLAIADRMKNASTASERLAIATSLPGKSWQNLIPLLSQGSEELNRTMQLADKFGLTISKDFAADADEFRDNLEILKGAFQGIFNQVAANVLPTLVELSKILVKVAEDGTVLRNSVLAITGAFALATDLGKALSKSFSKEEAEGFLNVIKMMQPGLLIVEKALDRLIQRGRLAELQRQLQQGIAVEPKTDEPAKELAVWEQALQAKQRLEKAFNEGDLESFKNLLKSKENEQLAHLGHLQELMKLEQGIEIEKNLFFSRQKEDLLREELANRQEVHRQIRESEDLRNLSSLESDILFSQRRNEIHRQSVETLNAINLSFHNEEQERRLSEIQALANLNSTREQMLNASLLRMTTALRNFSAQTANAISSGLGQAVADIATGAQTAEEAFKQFGKSLLAMLVKFAVQLVINSVLAAVLNKSIGTAAAATATSLAGAWAAAATAASIATFGAATAAGSAVIPLMAANASLGAGIAASFGGAAHGGLDFVPSDSTFLLKQGERVVQPQANEDLTEFLDSQGRVKVHVTINLDGRPIYDGIEEASRDGRLVLNARSIV